MDSEEALGQCWRIHQIVSVLMCSAARLYRCAFATSSKGSILRAKKIVAFWPFLFFRTPVHVLQLFSCHVIDHSEMRAGCALVLLELSERSKRADKHVSCAPEYMYGLLTRHDAWRNLKVARACATILNAMSRSSGQKMEIAKATLLPCIHLLWTFRKRDTRTNEVKGRYQTVYVLLSWRPWRHTISQYLRLRFDFHTSELHCWIMNLMLCCLIHTMLRSLHVFNETGHKEWTKMPRGAASTQQNDLAVILRNQSSSNHKVV